MGFDLDLRRGVSPVGLFDVTSQGAQGRLNVPGSDGEGKPLRRRWDSRKCNDAILNPWFVSTSFFRVDLGPTLRLLGKCRQVPPAS